MITPNDIQIKEFSKGVRGYKEDEPMGGYDMYSSSKGCVEIMSSSYRRSFLQEKDTYAMATARAGNVIGGGGWGLDRLIPDCIKSINNNVPIEIRNPIAIRPWQYVLEPLSGYLFLGQKLLEEGKKYAEGFNFGPNEESILKAFQKYQFRKVNVSLDEFSNYLNKVSFYFFTKSKYFSLASLINVSISS